MSSEMASVNRVRLIVTTADKAKKAEVTLPTTMTVADLIAACKKNWSLPSAEDFAIRDTSRNVQLQSKNTLADAGLSDGANLEVYPLLEAGAHGKRA